MAMDFKKMNAIHLYLTTCRYVLQADEYVTELYGLLSYLRQALSCCVCGQLLRQPLGPKPNVCQHFVCKDCIGSKMKLKPSCSWCKDSSEFVENTQILILVHCFKKLCEYLYSSRFVRNLIQSNGETNGLVLLVQEAIAFDENYASSIEGKLSVLPCMELLKNSQKKDPPGHKTLKKKLSQQPASSRNISSPSRASLPLFSEKRGTSYTMSTSEEIESVLPRTTTDQESRNGFSSGKTNRNNQQNIPAGKVHVKCAPTLERRKRSLWNSRGELACLEPGHRDDDDDDDQEQNIIEIQKHNSTVSTLELFSNVDTPDSSCKKLKVSMKESR